MTDTPNAPRERIVCPKCGYKSGDDWRQCNGSCPMQGSPHYSAAAALTPSPASMKEIEAAVKRNEEAWFKRGCAISDKIVAECRDARTALLDLIARSVATPGTPEKTSTPLFVGEPVPDDVVKHDALYRLLCSGKAAHEDQRYAAGWIVSLASKRSAPGTPDDEDEAYEIGKSDGYSDAVQEIDMLTGGDGEYRYCTDHDPDRHCPDPETMKRRIVERFEERGAPGTPAVPTGWKLVPIEPTEEMLHVMRFGEHDAKRIKIGQEPELDETPWPRFGVDLARRVYVSALAAVPATGTSAVAVTRRLAFVDAASAALHPWIKSDDAYDAARAVREAVAGVLRGGADEALRQARAEVWERAAKIAEQAVVSPVMVHETDHNDIYTGQVHLEDRTFQKFKDGNALAAVLRAAAKAEGDGR